PWVRRTIPLVTSDWRGSTMGLFDRESAEERDARRAKIAAYDAQYAEEARIERKRRQIAKTGYGPRVGRVDGKGGYGVTIHDDGTVAIGDREIDDYQECPLWGMRATLETLGQARDRVTATRLLALGVFALAAPKRD